MRPDALDIFIDVLPVSLPSVFFIVQELDPHVTAIRSSGYSNDPIMAYYETNGFKAFIVKPSTIATFSDAMNTAFANTGSGSSSDPT